MSCLGKEYSISHGDIGIFNLLNTASINVCNSKLKGGRKTVKKRTNKRTNKRTSKRINKMTNKIIEKIKSIKIKNSRNNKKF